MQHSEEFSKSLFWLLSHTRRVRARRLLETIFLSDTRHITQRVKAKAHHHHNELHNNDPLLDCTSFNFTNFFQVHWTSSAKKKREFRPDELKCKLVGGKVCARVNLSNAKRHPQWVFCSSVSYGFSNPIEKNRLKLSATKCIPPPHTHSQLLFTHFRITLVALLSEWVDWMQAKKGCHREWWKKKRSEDSSMSKTFSISFAGNFIDFFLSRPHPLQPRIWIFCCSILSVGSDADWFIVFTFTQISICHTLSLNFLINSQHTLESQSHYQF